MNEKERIIELVRQNVISMDEALRLLEASGDQTETNVETSKIKKNVENKNKNSKDGLNRFLKSVVNVGSVVVKEVVDAGSTVIQEVNDSLEKKADQNEKSEQSSHSVSEEETAEYQAQVHEYKTKGQEISDQIEQLNEQLHQAHEEAIIVQQRQRELEIYAEIDEMTPELKEQELNLRQEEEEIKQKIADLEEQIEHLYKQQTELHDKCQQDQKSDPDFRAFLEKSTEMLNEKASGFSQEASREGRKLGQQVTELVKSTMSNFTTKDVNVSVNVPWVKTQSLSHQFTFEASDLQELDIDILNGNLQLEAYEGDSIEVDASIKHHGNIESLTPEYVTEMSTLETIEGKLIIHVPSPKLVMDATIKVPHQQYQTINMKTLNGNMGINGLECVDLICTSKRGHLNIKNVNAREMKLDTKLGNVELEQVSIELLDLDLVNGNVDIDNSKISSIGLKNINGNFRINGEVGDIKANTVNGNFYITKCDSVAANISVETMHGNLKVSLPSEQAFRANLKTSAGKIQHRMASLDIEEISEEGKKAKLERQSNDPESAVQLDLTLTAGNIYLKDNDLTKEEL